jgi:MFS family permease
VREAVKSRRFIGLYAACLSCSFGLFVPFVHLIPYALDHGVGQSSAALLLGAIGVGSTAGRFFLGGLADKWGRDQALVLMFAGMGLSLLIWVCSTQWWSLGLFALVYGVFYGGFVAILPALVMDYFGGRHVSGIIGVLYTSVGFGTLVGPSAAGFAFDISHSYTLPILVGVAANIIAAVIVKQMAARTALPV